MFSLQRRPPNLFFFARAKFEHRVQAMLARSKAPPMPTLPARPRAVAVRKTAKSERLSVRDISGDASGCTTPICASPCGAACASSQGTAPYVSVKSTPKGAPTSGASQVFCELNKSEDDEYDECRERVEKLDGKYMDEEGELGNQILRCPRPHAQPSRFNLIHRPL